MSSFALFTLSCSDDDDNNDPGMSVNKITTPSGEHEIIGATLGDYGAGDWHDGFNLDLTFMTGNIELDNEGDPTGGAGLVAYFEMISSDAGELAEGDYFFEGDSEPYPVNTYSDSSQILDVADAANEEITSFEIGYGYIGDAFKLNINAYSTNWGNRFISRGFSNAQGEDGTAQFKDIDVSHKGVEIEADWRPNVSSKSFWSCKINQKRCKSWRCCSICSLSWI